MDERNVIGNVAGHLQEQMKRTVASTKAMQPYPQGTRPRTTREINDLWNQLIHLPREERQAMMVAMAERAGHVDGEEKMCELCRFISSKAAEASRAAA